MSEKIIKKKFELTADENRLFEKIQEAIRDKEELATRPKVVDTIIKLMEIAKKEYNID